MSICSIFLAPTYCGRPFAAPAVGSPRIQWAKIKPETQPKAGEWDDLNRFPTGVCLVGKKNGLMGKTRLIFFFFVFVFVFDIHSFILARHVPPSTRRKDHHHIAISL